MTPVRTSFDPDVNNMHVGSSGARAWDEVQDTSTLPV